jgi:hypothetical protein
MQGGLSYRIDPTAGIIDLLGEPTGQPDEVRELFQRVVADPAYQSSYGFLRNRGSLPPLRTPAVRALAEAMASVEGFVGTRWAIVALDPVNFGTMRMLQAMAERYHIEVSVFGDELAARIWLAEQDRSKEP